MLVVGMNSYITVSEAEELLQGDRLCDAFAALPEVIREKLLKDAALRVDSLPYAGRKSRSDQMMEFPREGMTEIPYRVKLAQAVEAVSVLDSEAEERRRMVEQGVIAVTVGKVSESYAGHSGTSNRGNQTDTDKSWDKVGLKTRTAYYLLKTYMVKSARIS